MTSHIIKDVKVAYGSRDITGILNQLGVSYGADLRDATVFGLDTRKRVSGLVQASASLNGFWDSGADSDFFSEIGAAPEVVSFAPNGHAEGDRAFILQNVLGSYNQDGQIGEIFPFTVEMQSADALVRGTLGIDQAITASGQSSAFNLGALASDERLFASLHVTGLTYDSGTTPTLDVTVVSDDDGTYNSASTTRISFTQITTSQVAYLETLAGSVSDPYWRFEWSLATDSGASASYTIFAVIGITNK